MINISRVEEIDFLKDSRILRQSSWSSFFLQMLPPLYCIVSSVSLCSPSPAVVMKRIYILVVSSHDRELVFLVCQIFLLRLRADFEEARVNYKFSISRTIVSPSNHLSNASGLAFSWLLQLQIWAENRDTVSCRLWIDSDCISTHFLGLKTGKLGSTLS